MRRVPFHCKTVPYNTSTQGKQSKTLRRGTTRAQSRTTTTGHDAKKTAKNLASRHDKGAIPHHNRTRRKENSKKLCVAARQGRNPAPQQDTTQGKQQKNLRHGTTRAQSRTTTGHNAGKTAKNFASRQDKGAIPHHNRTRRKENSKKPCVTARQGAISHHNRTQRRENSKKPCVAARQGAIPHHNNRTRRRENKEKLCVTIRKEQTPHNTGHDAEKT